MRIEREVCVEREVQIEGILMVATLPEAARRRCFLPSVEWDEAVKGDSERGVEGRCSEVLFDCCIFAIFLGVYRTFEISILQ